MDVFFQAWLKKRNAQEAEVLQSLYDRIFEPAYTYMKLNLNPKMELLECNYIMQVKQILYESVCIGWQ